MAEELMVVLNRSEHLGFGFSLLGTAGLPHIIYDIVENSPAAECGEVEAGDIILKVNETDVHLFSTKEVLKCLRLSTDPVTLKLKRDPQVKAHVRRYLSSAGQQDTAAPVINNHCDKLSPPPGQCIPRTPPHVASGARGHPQGARDSSGSDSDSHNPSSHSTDSARTKNVHSQRNGHATGQEDRKAAANQAPRFEAFMMTGDLMLNLSRTPQGQNLLPKQNRKVDSLRFGSNAPAELTNVPTSNPQNALVSQLPQKQATPEMAKKQTNSANSSPRPIQKQPPKKQSSDEATKTLNSGSVYPGFVRTSRSEDHLQVQQKDILSAVAIELDDDVTSSLNTLLDTRQDSDDSNAADRIVWTYNAPVSSPAEGRTGRRSEDSSLENSPLRSGSPTTSVSSSVMSSNSGSRLIHAAAGDAPSSNAGHSHGTGVGGGVDAGRHDHSISEAVSNISSPDYQEETGMDILGTRDVHMGLSDPSDSDSTILISEGTRGPQLEADHKIVIQVKGPDGAPHSQGYQELRDSLEDLPGSIMPSSNNSHGNNPNNQWSRGDSPSRCGDGSNYSGDGSDDGSDVDSLHSFHYSPKAVDVPSAIRLAKRLYTLDGFKKSDVSRHLSKNNDFSRAVADEYLRHFNFENMGLDEALRMFLKQFSLTGETQERERVLVHFSKRYLDCNVGSFNSQDAVHTLTCAIMLLNTDLHGQNIGRKMTCGEFIDNLSELNDGDNFPREVLKQLYTAIKNHPLEWALDEELEDAATMQQRKNQLAIQSDGGTINLAGPNPFLELPDTTSAVEYKKGYVMRKCCYDADAKKICCGLFTAPLGKRGWKMFYCTLRDLVLYLHKDEHGFRKSQMSDNLHNAIRIHHALATKAQDYTKKQHVFRLHTADQAEYLFQTSDSKELQSWIDTINFVCASFSAQPLDGAVGSQRRFQRPLLPCSHTKLNLHQQLQSHEERVIKLEAELDEHRKSPPERTAKALLVQNYKEKDAYLQFELKRYKTYSVLLRSKLTQYPNPDMAGGLGVTDECIVAPPIPDRPLPGLINHRYNRSTLNTLNNMNYHTTNGDGEYPGDILSRTSSDSEHNSLMQQASSNYKYESINHCNSPSGGGVGGIGVGVGNSNQFNINPQFTNYSVANNHQYNVNSSQFGRLSSAHNSNSNRYSYRAAIYDNDLG